MECPPGPDFTYLNAAERNVHVWASVLSPRNHVCLVAGCYNDGGLNFATFYTWLSHIIVADPAVHSYVLVAAGQNGIRAPNGQNLQLVAFNAYVQGCMFQRTFVALNSTAVIPSGDYLLFQLTVNGFLQPVLPQLQRAQITSRIPTRGNTGTNTKQRNHEASTMLNAATRAALGRGDHPGNAILMRNDAHDQFDDYQFGFWPDSQNVLRFYRFERTGAMTLQQVCGSHLFPSLGTQAVPQPIVALLCSHFVTALLWHVAGLGRPMGK
ncbi:hypothetical protein DFH07DRAFT_960648 [Mycena maculata]|uniref:HNH nuclease domain-containing protein n=1 Tax=Mycena maculata TaxID=230809 RepID=A0AAD7N9B1_9AGAR|nr:hypothetical protein DFH07DRAFT_960648 [Mycena maculata]